MIRMPAAVLDAVRAHAAVTYPHECCGLLLGRSADGLGADREAAESIRPRRDVESVPSDPDPESVQSGRDVASVPSHPDPESVPSDPDVESVPPGRDVAESVQSDPGVKSAQSSREATESVQVGNARADERTRRYLIPPDVVRQVDADATRRGLEIVGFYHSHPDHPAEPSAFDREHAWPWYTYVIVPVQDGRPGTARAWRLADDRDRFEEERITLEERS